MKLLKVNFQPCTLQLYLLSSPDQSGCVTTDEQGNVQEINLNRMVEYTKTDQAIFQSSLWQCPSHHDPFCLINKCLSESLSFLKKKNPHRINKTVTISSRS